MRLCKTDLGVCDALIIIGTSLTVQPFASLVEMAGGDVPRLLINRDRVGESFFSGGLDFDSGRRDVHLGGTCDDSCRELAEALELGPAFAALLAEASALSTSAPHSTEDAAQAGRSEEQSVAAAADALAAVTLSEGVGAPPSLAEAEA
jgi:NAD-dependent deacetylase sirtuin 2